MLYVALYDLIVKWLTSVFCRWYGCAITAESSRRSSPSQVTGSLVPRGSPPVSVLLSASHLCAKCLWINWDLAPRHPQAQQGQFKTERVRWGPRRGQTLGHLVSHLGTGKIKDQTWERLSNKSVREDCMLGFMCLSYGFSLKLNNRWSGCTENINQILSVVLSETGFGKYLE